MTELEPIEIIENKDDETPAACSEDATSEVASEASIPESTQPDVMAQRLDVMGKHLAEMGSDVSALDAKAASFESSLEEMGGVVSELKDLFVRRLYEDRQKGELIRSLEAQVHFAHVEPFLHDLILLLDRLDRAEDDFSLSVRDELFDILQRRGVERITVTQKFDPSLHRALRVVRAEPGDPTGVTAVIRRGYTYGGKVLRPAEVIVARAKRVPSSETEA